MDLITPLLLLSGLAILNKKSSSSSSNISGEYGSIKNGKFVPRKQPSFKNQLNEILIDLEEKLEIEDLRDFLMGVAWVESKFYPSAIRYETTGFIGVQNNPTRFKNNKWRNNPVYWNFTLGLFQMFPSTALSVSDGAAKNNNPLTLANPYYSIAYGIDFASRLNKSYGAKTWFDIRLGWHSLVIKK